MIWQYPSSHLHRHGVENSSGHQGARRLADSRRGTSGRGQARLRAAQARLEGLRGREVGPESLRRALAEFSPIREVLLPVERARVLGLLLEGVDYHGGTQRLGLSFRPTGLGSLGAEPAAEEAVAP